MRIQSFPLTSHRMLILWAASLFGLLTLLTLTGSGHAAALTTQYSTTDNPYANCGVHNSAAEGGNGVGGNQQAAGVVIDLKWIPYDNQSVQIEDESPSNGATITTHGYSWKPDPATGQHIGGIAHLTANDDTEQNLINSANFNQVNAHCKMNGNGYDSGMAIVLGYGATSTANGWNHWALDCEETNRSGAASPSPNPPYTNTRYDPTAPQDVNYNTLYQPFDLTGYGTPSGARAGGWWSTEHIAPFNGNTVYIVLVYHEPPPTPQGGGVCDYFTETGSKYVRKEVHITGVSDGPGKLTSTFTDGSPTATTTWTHSANFDEYTPSPPPSLGGPNEKPGTYQKEWSYQATSPTITVTVNTWDYNVNGAWTRNPTSTNTFTRNCISDSCSIDPNSVSDDVARPNNIIVAGDPVTITATITNTSPPDGPDLNWPYLTGSDGVGSTGAGILGPGDSGPVTIHTNAPSGSPQVWRVDYTVSGVPAQSSCYFSVPVYQYFNINPMAKIAAGTSQENPYIAGTTTPGVSYEVGGHLSEGPAITTTTSGWLEKNTIRVDGYHDTTDTYGDVDHKYDYSDSSFKAGDQYCPWVTISPANGYRGPSGYPDVSPQPATQKGGCLTVVNEPYFKVRGSGAAADLTVSRPDGTCPNVPGDGLLAGYNDNSEYGADRGAGSQLSALALIKISGFASAQTTITRPPTNLTFANTSSDGSVSIGNDLEAPDLGGSFGGTARCVTPPKPPSNAGPGSSILRAGTGNYRYTGGNLTLSGNTSISNQSSIFVTAGNVYITGNIKYSGTAGGWTAGNAPSFVLVATGNIYVSPSVTELDGLYIAQPNNSGNGGVIYTCGTSATTACQDTSIYAANRQLAVYGSFVANQVRMYRALGSLRDEKPTPGTGGSAGTTLGLVWSCGGGSCNPDLSGLRCIYTNEPADPDTWNDNQLCVPSSSSLQLFWTYKGETSSAYPYCVPWVVSEDSSQGWSDNKLCSNQNKNLSWETSDKSSTTRECVKIVEPADHDGQWTSGYYLCGDISPPSPPSPPTAPALPPPNCSNYDGISSHWPYKGTCAAEVFQLSPEFYLSNPAVLPPSNGAPQFDSINSLPPVL